MVTKRDLEVAIGAYGLGRILPPGSTRAAVTAAVKGIVRGGRLIARPTASTVARTGLGVGRTLAGLSPAGRLVLGGLTVAEAYERGLLDAPIERSREIFTDAFVEGIERTAPFMPDQGPPEGFEGFGAGKPRKKKTTKYNRAVKAGMAAVKASKFGGKKGTLSNPKRTFGRVNKVASSMNKGKKVGTKGETGTIRRAIKRFI